eukprot:gene1327-7637_t
MSPHHFDSTVLSLDNAAGLAIAAPTLAARRQASGRRAAHGATVWFGVGGGVQLNGCSNVSIDGLTIDYAPTLAQGTV